MFRTILITTTLALGGCGSAPELASDSKPSDQATRLAHCDWNIPVEGKCSADTPNEGETFFVSAPHCSIVLVTVDGAPLRAKITDKPKRVGKVNTLIEVTSCQLYKENWHTG